MCLNGTFLPGGLCVCCPLSEQQSDGTQDDALSRSSLSRDDREAWVEGDIQFIDECVVPDMEMCQHLFFDFFPSRVLAGVDGKEDVIDRLFLFGCAFALVDVGKFIFLEVGPYLR